MLLTREQLVGIMPYTKQKRADNWLLPLNWAMEEFNVNTPIRIACFLANVAHESGELLYVRELASGEEYDTGRKALRLGNTPEDDDDGRKYKGRGPIQITGADNYRRCGLALDLPLLEHPEWLEQPVNGSRAAGWFWETNGLNALAELQDFTGCCAVVNTGNRLTPAAKIRGYAERARYYRRACKLLGV